MATRLRPAETVHVGLQHWSRDYDATLPAAASVHPGAEVAVDLHCCSRGAVQRDVSTRPDRFYEELAYTPGMPVTGPIDVVGAEPGDTLLIEVREIKVAPTAWDHGPQRARSPSSASALRPSSECGDDRCGATAIRWRARGDAMTLAIPPSLWTATAAPELSCPPLSGAGRADVCVVGGGFTGLSAALHLAEAGADVTLLEAAEPGYGASGRNGGQVIPGLKLDPDAIEAWLGPERGGRVVELVGGAADFVFDLVRRHAIPCEVAPVRLDQGRSHGGGPAGGDRDGPRVAPARRPGRGAGSAPDRRADRDGCLPGRTR